MYFAPERGVTQHERHDTFIGDLADRDAARVFPQAVRCPEVITCGGFLATADRLELSNVARRQIDGCAQQNGATKSARDAHGVVGKWYRSIVSNESTSIFDFAVIRVAAGFRGCVK